MTIYMLRHTHPKIDKGICYGNSDVELADSFEKEWIEISSKISTISFDIIFSSPLQRCAILAEKICPPNKQIILDDRLKELNFGKWELKKWDEIYKNPESKKWFNNFINEPAPGGESYQDLINRLTKFVDYLKTLKKNNKILIITHAGVIRAAYSILKNHPKKSSFDLKIGYGQLFSFQI